MDKSTPGVTRRRDPFLFLFFWLLVLFLRFIHLDMRRQRRIVWAHIMIRIKIKVMGPRVRHSTALNIPRIIHSINLWRVQFFEVGKRGEKRGRAVEEKRKKREKGFRVRAAM